MKRIFAFVTVLIGIIMLSSCSATQNQQDDRSSNVGESQVSTQSPEPSAEPSSNPESAPATGISLLSDDELKELEDIAEDVIEAWNYYSSGDGICCEREDYEEYDFLNDYIDEETQEQYNIIGAEKITCCKTKEEVKEHLAKYLDLTSILQDLPSSFDYPEERDIYSVVENSLFEHEGKLYRAYAPWGIPEYGLDDMIIKRIDDKTFSTTVDLYEMGELTYNCTYEFMIQHNGDNYVAFDINEVSGSTFLLNKDYENVEQPDYYALGFKYIVNSDAGVDMRYGPGEDYEIITNIPDGEEVIERGCGENSEWTLIEYNGQFGWVAEEFLEYIDESDD